MERDCERGEQGGETSTAVFPHSIDNMSAAGLQEAENIPSGHGSQVAVGEYAERARKVQQEAEAQLARIDHSQEDSAAVAAEPMPMPENWRARCRSTVPLDFSFSKVNTVEDLLTLTPVERERRPGTSSGRPKSSGSAVTARSGVAGLRESQYSCDIEAVTALRLNNNTLATVEGLLPTVMPRLVPFHSVSQLLWLDLSFNQLTDVDEALLEFTSLSVLYLHANQIQESANYQLLSNLKSLTNLAIHGNPMDAVPNIHKKLLATLPNLTKLNFSPVTRLQRADAEQWKASQARARAKHRK